MTDATWTLPWPHRVTVNSLYTSAHTLTVWAKRWRDEVLIAVRQSGLLSWDTFWDCRLEFVIDFWPPTEGKHDGDNLIKLAVDVVCQEACVDDTVIWRHITTRHAADRDNPRLVVRVKAFEEEI